MFSPFLLLSFLSPLVFLTLPLLLERFLSTNDHYWLQVFHYTATISPIIVMSAADGLGRFTKRLRPRHASKVVLAAAVIILLLNIQGLTGTEFRQLTNPEFYELTSTYRTGRQALTLIPPHASVTAQDGLLPWLANRQTIFVLKPSVPLTDYVVASTSVSTGLAGLAEVQQLIDGYKSIGYQSVFEQDGWLVLHHE
jgi:uncharacterized membrane protein